MKERGKVTVKGKGEMVTYWVESKANRIPPTEAEVRLRLSGHEPHIVKSTELADQIRKDDLAGRLDKMLHNVHGILSRAR